jgi:predicted ATPase/DNA-binding CsgD family transcriptional regulator
MATVVQTELVGRDNELELIARSVDAALEGNGSVLTFVGEPGIGKTSLATHAAQQFAAKAQNGIVLWGRSIQSRGSFPFDPWTAVLHALASTEGIDLDDRFPNVQKLLKDPDSDPNPTDPSQSNQSHRLFEEIDRFIRSAAKSQPICIVLDDLQWADITGMNLFEYIAKGCSTSPLLIVGTYRDSELTLTHPLSRVVGNLVPEAHFAQNHLERLTSDDALKVFNTASTTKSPNSKELVAAASGNPLFLVELARSVPTSGNQNSGPISISIKEVVSRHLTALSSPAIDVLQTSALLDSDWPISDASLIFEEPASALQAWDEAEKIGLLEQAPHKPGSLQFWHPLIREALVTGMTTVESAKRHSIIATALEPTYKSIPTKIQTLAHHFTEAIPITGKEPALEYLTLAADQAIGVQAYESAHDMYSTILELFEGQRPSLQWADASWGFALSGIYAFAGSERNVLSAPMKAAFDYYVENGLLDRALAIAMTPFTGGNAMRADYHEIIQRAIEFTDDDSRETGHLLSNLANAHFYETGEFEVSIRYLDDALKLADAHADLHLRSQVLKNIMDIRHFNNVHEESDIELLEQAISAARKIGNYMAEAECTRSAVFKSLQLGNGVAAVRFANECLAAAEAARNSNMTTYALTTVAVAAEAIGDWDRFYEASDRAMKMDPLNTSLMQERLRAEEALGNYDYVDEKLNELASHLPTMIGDFDRINIAMVYLEAVHRTPYNAQIALDLVSTPSEVSGQIRRVTVQTNLMIGLANVELGNQEPILKVLDWFEANPDVSKGEMFVDVTISLLQSSVGRDDEAINRLAPYIERFSTTNFTVKAYVNTYMARAFISRGRSEDLIQGTKLLEEAQQVADEFGLAGQTHRIKTARALLNSASATATRADGLTNRELEILALVATGKSNPQIAEELFISRHTVVRHVSNILDKIGVENRSQATAYAINRDIT